MGHGGIQKGDPHRVGSEGVGMSPWIGTAEFAETTMLNWLFLLNGNVESKQ